MGTLAKNNSELQHCTLTNVSYKLCYIILTISEDNDRNSTAIKHYFYNNSNKIGIYQCLISFILKATKARSVANPIIFGNVRSNKIILGILMILTKKRDIIIIILSLIYPANVVLPYIL